MTDRRILAATVVLLVATAAWTVGARADQILLEATPLVQGSLVSDTTLNVGGPGTVTVTLSDLAWPDKLASLTFAATTPSSVLASMTGPGAVSFNVNGAGFFTAVVGAVASPSSFLGLGWYSLTIDFAPAAVPLPATAWLLLAALGGFAALSRRKGLMPQRPQLAPGGS